MSGWSWPGMDALHRQRKADIAAPIKPRTVGYGLVELRRGRDIETRIEYGMGNAWKVLRIGKLRIWIRAELS